MGTDKALLIINQKTLLENAIEKCKTLCNEILISSDNREHAKFGFGTIPDEFKNCGPLSGIYSCLKKSKTEWNFVISVDSAFVETEFIAFLCNKTGNFDAIVPSHNKGKEPLISMYHKRCIPAMYENLKSGDYKMHNLLDEINTRYIDSQNWVESFPGIFRNLNRPDDFQISAK
jgi:molybdopterin-guanine dinucleotide biosynthesis protein A